MHLGKGIAFIGGFAVAGFASALLMNGDARGSGDAVTSDPFERRARATETSPSSLDLFGNMDQRASAPPLIAIEQASRALFGALRDGDWVRTQRLLLSDDDLTHVTWNDAAVGALGAVEHRRFAFEEIADLIAGAQAAQLEFVNLLSSPVMRDGHGVAEEVDWVLTLDGEPVLVRCGELIEIEGRWRFLDLPRHVWDVFGTIDQRERDQAAALCRENLQRLDRAVHAWAEEVGGEVGRPVPAEGLIYPVALIRDLPLCPAGGQYGSSLGESAFVVGEMPICTCGGTHGLP